jgi:hypothetical protein
MTLWDLWVLALNLSVGFEDPHVFWSRMKVQDKNRSQTQGPRGALTDK